MSRDTLQRIVQAGIQAPSGYNGLSTSFMVVDDPSLREKIGEILASEVVKAAPAIIAYVMDPRATEDKGLLFGGRIIQRRLRT